MRLCCCCCTSPEPAGWVVPRVLPAPQHGRPPQLTRRPACSRSNSPMQALAEPVVAGWIRTMRQCADLPARPPERRSGTPHVMFVNRAVASGRSVLSMGQVQPTIGRTRCAPCAGRHASGGCAGRGLRCWGPHTCWTLEAPLIRPGLHTHSCSMRIHCRAVSSDPLGAAAA